MGSGEQREARFSPLGAESARRGPIGWCRHAEGARRERDDGDVLSVISKNSTE